MSGYFLKMMIILFIWYIVDNVYFWMMIFVRFYICGEKLVRKVNMINK